MKQALLSCVFNLWHVSKWVCEAGQGSMKSIRHWLFCWRQHAQCPHIKEQKPRVSTQLWPWTPPGQRTVIPFLRCEILVTFVQSKQPEDITSRGWNAREDLTKEQQHRVKTSYHHKMSSWSTELPISLPQAQHPAKESPVLLNSPHMRTIKTLPSSVVLWTLPCFPHIHFEAGIWAHSLLESHGDMV